MDEAQIAEQLKRNIPSTEAPETTQKVTEPEPEKPSDGQIVRPVELDELTMFRLHDYFGLQYKGSNVQDKAHIQFIYDDIASQIGTRDYVAVLSRINELERMLGSSHSEQRLNKLYQWVGLDNTRRKAEAAMRLLNV